ncbi:efflux RND transporter permease subunit [Alkalibacter mobilis]|uniref:efflux RND transporter permease subunit n=1 Tax=Alkalibacter mobilis TaxID=2787712 RepID=UPI00189E5BFF|nr:hydrophobe/amphiphile efflux-3 (HAE3) family transporter [Alkalibacter mobilis]MBF7095587.1 MMPL family transporter [Alkalibacter mobilis]
MHNLFSKLGALIERRPIKVLLISLLAFAILISGVRSIGLSTGNETLVQSDNPVFINNKEMEDEFGSDSILILFEGENLDTLLSSENIRKMWNIEQKLGQNENIYSVMSPAGMINQISTMQSENIKDAVLEISDGLGEIGNKLTEVGTELKNKDLMDPSEIEEKLNSLSGVTTAFDKLIDGQTQLSSGALQLKDGLLKASGGLNEASAQLEILGQSAAQNPELQMKLNAIARNIAQSAQGIETMGTKSSGLSEGALQSAGALENIKTNLAKETESMKAEMPNGMDPKEIDEMADGFIEIGANLTDISEAMDTFHTKSQMMIADIPALQSEIDEMFYDGQTIRSVFSQVVVDDSHVLMVAKLNGNVADSQKDVIVSDLKQHMESEGFETIDYTISGKPVLDSSLRSEMQKNMQMMVMAAVVIMLVILTLIFKVKWRILSLGIIMISVVATLGLMGWINVPITMVSMAVFPILIGLGIDYSIQFHNRYEEDKSVKTTITHIGKAVAVAVLATFLGFISLYASPVPMIQDFGKMLTIGVVISFIGSIFILMSILKLRDDFSDVTEVKVKNDPDLNSPLLDRIFAASTRIVIKFSAIIFVVAIIVSSIGFSYDSKIGVESNIENFMPQDMDALSDIRYIRDTVGSTEQIILYLNDNDILSEENISWIESKSDQLLNDYPEVVVNVNSILTPVQNMDFANDTGVETGIREKVLDLPDQQKKMFINEDLTQGIVILEIKYLPTEKLQSFIFDLKSEISDSPMDVDITGKSVLDVEMVKGLTSGRVEMTLIGLGLVFAALLLIYRNFFKALIPLLPVVLIIGMSAGSMHVLGLSYTPITATLGALILGMGTEMTVMVMERYLEERRNGENKTEAMITSIKMIGKAVLASGLTTIGGFSVLIFSEFVILKDFGLMTVINISLALISTFLVLPSIIYIFDRFLFSKKEKRELLKTINETV